MVRRQAVLSPTSVVMMILASSSQNVTDELTEEPLTGVNYQITFPSEEKAQAFEPDTTKLC